MLSIYSLGKRTTPGALPFAIGSLLTGLWLTGAVFRYAAVDSDTLEFWYKFESLWQLSAITAITCFILEYAWPGRWLTRRNLILLGVVPVLDIFLILTNDLHQLQWSEIISDGFIIPRQGPFGWFIFVYAFALAIPNVIVLVWLFLRSPAHRWPATIILTGQITVRLIYLLGAVNLLRSDLPLDTLSIGFIFLLYAIVLFRFRIFDPVPLAQQTAIEQIQTGIIVLDARKRVVSVNPAAEQMLGLSARQAKDPAVHDWLTRYSIPIQHGTEVELTIPVEQEHRHYILSVSVLRDFRQLEIGHLLMLQDVTKQKHAQARILEQQRVVAVLHERERLARELHDGLGQVFAFINSQGQAVNRLLGRDDIAAATTYLDRMVDIAREADQDIRESILSLRANQFELGFFPALIQYLARYEKNFGVQAELLLPDDFENVVLDPQVEVQLMRILQEALTNVRKHALAKSVQVAFQYQDGWICVTVRDDGKGFEAIQDRDAASERIGLVVMRERAEEVGGSIQFSSAPGEGTEVTVQMPVKREISHG